jgi:hypothetical protein
MSFLSSSGNIIEARLTRKGREAMANGTFNITQFALSDDGVNYNLYDSSLGDNADAQILALPVLEPNTNDNAALKNLLITMDEGTQIVTFLTTNPTSIVIQSTNPTASIFVKTNNAGGITEQYDVIEINNTTLWNRNIAVNQQVTNQGGKSISFTYKNDASLTTQAIFTFKLQGKSSGVQSDTLSLTAEAYTAIPANLI